MTKNLLELKDLRFSYNKAKEVIKGIDLEIKRGDVKVIIGPSGSGKSTLLQTINLLNVPDSGTIWYKGIEVTNSAFKNELIRNNISIVFQHFDLFEHFSVYKNIVFSARITIKKVIKLLTKDLKNISEESKSIFYQSKEELESKLKALTSFDIDKHANKLMRDLGIAHLKNKYPDSISGGEKQRVSIARALISQPEIILFDEPTLALDPKVVGDVMKIIRDLVNEGRTMIITTHEMEFAKEIATSIVFMDKGKIIEESQSKDIFSKPKQERTKKFLDRVINKTSTL